jgi:acyl-homoserine-lactone acylase
MGPGVAPPDLRARLGLQLAQQAFSATPVEQGAAAGGTAGGVAGGAEGGSGQTVKPVVKPVVRHVSAADVRRFTLDGTSLSAQRFKPAVLDQVCTSAHIEVAKDPSTGQAFTPPRVADTTAACDTLRTWDGTGSVDARGAYLWDEFWARASRIAPSRLYRTPFNPADPLHTPADIRANDPDIAQAFGAAILAVTDAGFTVDAKRGDTLFITRDGKPIPLYGGCAGVGYFTSV